MEFEWGIRNEKSSKDSLRHLKNLIPFHLPSLVSHMAYRSRSIFDAPADAPPDTLARPPCPQVSQWHPRVAKGSSKRPLARTPCPQVFQWHPRVAKGVCMGYGGIGGSNAMLNSDGLSLTAISDRGSSDGMKPSPHTSSPDGRNWHTDGSRFLLAE